jgi:hypothetical protein
MSAGLGAIEVCRDLARQGITERGCTLDGYIILKIFKDRKSAILGVWATPGDPETLAIGGGLRPHISEGPPGPPGAAQTPKMTDFRTLEN